MLLFATLLALAVHSYVQAWKLLEEQTDWIGYIRNTVASCMFMLLFILFLLSAAAIVAIVLSIAGIRT